jgi:hypothetical protein
MQKSTVGTLRTLTIMINTSESNTLPSETSCLGYFEEKFSV